MNKQKSITNRKQILYPPTQVNKPPSNILLQLPQKKYSFLLVFLIKSVKLWKLDDVLAKSYIQTCSLILDYFEENNNQTKPNRKHVFISHSCSFKTHYKFQEKWVHSRQSIHL